MTAEFLINESNTAGIIFVNFTNNVTGSIFLTMLFFIVVIMLFFLAARLPLEASAILVLPMLLVFMAYNTQLIAIGGVFLIYLAVLFAKNLFINQ